MATASEKTQYGKKFKAMGKQREICLNCWNGIDGGGFILKLGHDRVRR
jgi:hypothetical protein